jgi:hypothetical protein
MSHALSQAIIAPQRYSQFKEMAMRTFRSALAASAAVVALGAAGAAFAQSPQTHVMTVRLPDGRIGQIEYTGNVPPRVEFSSGPSAIDAAFGPTAALFGPSSPFAMMDRISADMDRQAAAMFRQVDAMAVRAQTGQPLDVGFSNISPGSQGYSFVSTMSGNGACMRSVQITSDGSGGAPKVVSRSSGNCGPATAGSVNSVNLPDTAMPAAQPPVPSSRPDMLWTSVPTAKPLGPASRPDVVWTSTDPRAYKGMVRKVTDDQR